MMKFVNSGAPRVTGYHDSRMTIIFFSPVGAGFECAIDSKPFSVRLIYTCQPESRPMTNWDLGVELPFLISQNQIPKKSACLKPSACGASSGFPSFETQKHLGESAFDVSPPASIDPGPVVELDVGTELQNSIFGRKYGVWG